MVSLEATREAITSRLHSSPFTAVVVGGTAGIGEFTVRGLAESHGKDGSGLHVIIVGRNREAAEKIINECKEICPPGKFDFVQVKDLTLLKNVDSGCAEVATLVGDAGIDFLAMSQGFLRIGQRQDTSEGLDALMSIIYYSRMRVLMNLVPQLLASKSPNGARVMSVLNPNLEGKIHVDDLSLRTNFSTTGVMGQVSVLTTLFMEAFAAKHAGKIALVHYYPGFVQTNIFDHSPISKWITMPLKVIMAPLSWIASISHAECGQRVVFLGTSPMYAPATSTPEDSIAVGSDGVKGSGAYRVSWNGDIISPNKVVDQYREEGLREKVFRHTISAFEEIEAGKVFKE